jgi:hypothetical protein
MSQGVSVPSGAQFSVGAGSLDLGCGDLSVAGTFSLNTGSAVTVRDVAINSGTINGGSGTLSLSGNWTNLGQFNAQSSSVQIVDGCGTTASALTGNTTFASLAVSSASGKQLTVASGSTQTFSDSLSLSGVSGNRLLLRTSQPGTTAAFNLLAGASDTISWLDVQDIDASGGQAIAPGSPASFNSVDSGNNSNWFVAVMNAIPVTTLPLPAMVLLALLLTLLVSRKLPDTKIAIRDDYKKI